MGALDASPSWYAIKHNCSIILSKLKSGERLTPPKANVCGERCARAVRACGARVRCARAVRDICAQ